MLRQPVAVLGGGNGGHCIAADLTLAGYKVNFFQHPKFEASFKPTLETGIVELIMPTHQEQVKIHKVTTDMRDTLGDAKLIIVAVPAFGHEAYFSAMIPHLKDGQVVFLMPGNFGSLRLRKLLHDKAPGRRITIYETNTLSYGARLIGAGKVHAFYGPRDMPADLVIFPRVVSALPAKDTGVALEEFKKLFPVFSPIENVLAAALSNPNYPVHPVGSLLNTGRIEYSQGDFYLYKEAITPAVLRIMNAVCDERAAVAEALGTKVAQLKQPFDTIIADLKVRFAGILGPTSTNDRYITEDVPYGLVPMSQLAKKLGVVIPVVDGLIDIASVVCEKDFRKNGRTLETLGLAELNKQQVISLVNG